MSTTIHVHPPQPALTAADLALASEALDALARVLWKVMDGARQGRT